MIKGDSFLTFIESVDEKSGLYLCKCGNRVVAKKYDVLNERKKSCGCKVGGPPRHNRGSKLKRDRTYTSWISMRNRCNPKTKWYRDIGNYDGIRVCKRWDLFENFLEDMGERPLNMTLDRIDSSKGYFKENCRWADVVTQNNNRRTNRLINYHGITQSISQWGKCLNIKECVISDRLKKGMPIEYVFFQGDYRKHKYEKLRKSKTLDA